MHCFKLPVAAATFAVFFSCTSFAQIPQASMFKDVPSIAKLPSAKQGSQRSMKVQRLKDGTVSIDGKLHGGGGIQTNIVIPKINYDVRIDGPAGLDKNGRPTTWNRKIDRAMGHAIVYQGLKARGYKYEEHRKQREAEGLVTQLDQWKAQNKATKEYIEKYGPITTKNFIVPGSSPEKSAILSDPNVGVRKENGKLAYYYRGQKLDLTHTTKKTGSKTHRITQQKTHLSVSRKKDGVDPTNAKLQRTPPVAEHRVDPEEDLRRNPTDVFVDPATLPTIQDLETIFGSGSQASGADHAQEQDLNSTQDLNNKANKQRKPLATTGMLKSLEPFIGLLLGTSTAQAQDVTLTASRQTHEVKQHLTDVVSEIKNNNDRLVRELKEKMTSPLQGAEFDSAKEDARSYLPLVTDDTFDPAVFAAEVVNRSQKSLTPEQFEDDVRTILASISASDSPANAVVALAKMLDSNPEIYTVIPDADRKLRELSGQTADLVSPDSTGEATYIFISYSLSENVLKDIVKRHQGRNDVTLVMRGVPKGMTIHEGVQKIQKVASSVEPIASVIIDPSLFREYDIKHVPAVVRVGRKPSPLSLTPNGQSGRKFAPLLAKVAGLHNDKWLMERIEAGEQGDLGIQGHLSEITEPDLIEEMKKRVASIDWEEKKRAAIERFWKKQEFHVLPTADEERLREIDPTILVEKDLKDLAGNFIREAGDRVNPLRIRPFTQTIVVFNPVSEEEMSRVEAFLSAQRQQGLPMPVMIATQIDKKKDWDGYTELTDRLESHVFLLTPEVRQQWQLEKTPSIISADNNRHVFLVKELGPVETTNKVNNNAR